MRTTVKKTTTAKKSTTINKRVNTTKAKRNLPTGIYSRGNGTYRVMVWADNKLNYLGTFTSLNKAKLAKSEWKGAPKNGSRKTKTNRK